LPVNLGVVPYLPFIAVYLLWLQPSLRGLISLEPAPFILLRYSACGKTPVYTNASPFFPSQCAFSPNSPFPFPKPTALLQFRTLIKFHDAGFRALAFPARLPSPSNFLPLPTSSPTQRSPPLAGVPSISPMAFRVGGPFKRGFLLFFHLYGAFPSAFFSLQDYVYIILVSPGTGLPFVKISFLLTHFSLYSALIYSSCPIKP